MDFSLSSLRRAFHENYSASQHREYKLYGFLLATSADKQFFPGILAYADELRYLTANDILIIGPELWGNTRPLTTDEVLKIFRTGFIGKEFVFGPKDVGTQISAFIERQTRESHDFIRFLGEDATILPCLIFFNDLKKQDEYFIWELQDYEPEQFIREFREIYSELKSKCMWDLQNQINAIKSVLQEDDGERYWLEWQLDKQEKRIRILKLPSLIIEAYEEALSDIDRHHCVDNAKKLMDELRNGVRGIEIAKKLGRYRRRWSSRLPKNLNYLLREYNSYATQSAGLLCDSKYIEEINNEVDRIKQRIEEINNNKGGRKAKKEHLQQKVKLLQAQYAPQPAFEILDKLKRKSFIRRRLRKIGDSIPWIDLGKAFFG